MSEIYIPPNALASPLDPNGVIRIDVDGGTKFTRVEEFAEDPVFASQYAPLLLEQFTHIPGLGMDVGQPANMCTDSIAASNQRQLMIFFRVAEKMTVNAMSFASDSTAAGATPTRIQYSLYAITDDDQAFPLAQCSNDTSIFQATMTVYQRSFNSTWADTVTLVPGRTYAASILVDTAATNPTLCGSPGLRTVMQTRHRCKRTGAATTLVGVWQSSWGWETRLPWVNITPGGTTNLARSAVLLGDSFFASYAGWFGFGNAQGNARLHPVNNAGVGSESLDDMAARWATDVTPWSPEWVVLHGGTNDVHADSASAATIQARYEALIALAQADGANLLICTPPPNTTSSAGQKTVLGDVRTYLLALNEAGVTVADTGIALTTGDGVTADAAKLVDTVHPNATGIQAMADALDGIIAAIT